MNAEQILDFIRSMAMSQGFYGRLLRTIQEDSTILDTLVAQNFSDSLDLVDFLECWRNITMLLSLGGVR